VSLVLPASLSPSKVATFKDCALAFRFSAIDRLPEQPSVAAARGTVVHRALELLMCQPGPQRTLEAAMGCLEAAVPDVLDGDGEYGALVLDDRDTFVTEAEQLVRRYFDLEDPTAVRPIGLELMMEAEVGGVRLRGVLDRLDLGPDGELVVTDYKTGMAPGIRNEQRRLGGVHFYAYLCEAVLGVRPARIQLLYLGDPVAIVAVPSEQSIRGLERKVGAIWSAVERACEEDDFRPNPGPLCDWCSFKAFCPAFGGDPEAARRRAPATAEIPGQLTLEMAG
jgi:putative RecB family exonuclease